MNPDTGPEAIAALCKALRRDSMYGDDEAAATIEALQAERDAALARVDAALAERDKAEEWLKMAKSNTADYERVVMGMGRREATAAIVAYTKRLRHDEAFYRVCVEMDNLAARIERGDHLKETGQ